MTTSAISAAVPAPTHAEYLSLSYRSDLRIVVLRWLRDATLPELQLGHQAALHLARQHAATHWFMDVRRRLLVNSSHARWVTDEFLPQVAALLPQPLRVAYLMSPSRQRILASTPDLQATIARLQTPGLTYRVEAFVEEASAMAWLYEL